MANIHMLAKIEQIVFKIIRCSQWPALVLVEKIGGLSSLLSSRYKLLHILLILGACLCNPFTIFRFFISAGAEFHFMATLTETV